MATGYGTPLATTFTYATSECAVSIGSTFLRTAVFFVEDMQKQHQHIGEDQCGCYKCMVIFERCACIRIGKMTLQ